MAIAYNWVISKMEYYPEKEGNEQVVSNIYWKYQAKDGKYFAEVYGSQLLNTDNINKFVPYSKLTKEQVIAWLEEVMGKTKIDSFKSELALAIESQKSPPVVSSRLPWEK